MVPAVVPTQSKPVFNTTVRPISAAVPKIMVTRPRHAHSPVTKYKSPIRRHITCSPSPKTSNSPPKVTAIKTPVVSAAQGMKGKWNDDLDAFDSDCDEAPSARAMLMANLSSYDSDKNDMIMSIIDEMSNQVAKSNAVNIVNETVHESLTAELERYKEQIKVFEERQKVDLNDHEKYINSQMREMIVNRNAKFASFENEIHTLKLRLSKNMDKNKYLTTAMDVLKKETKEKEDKYLEEIVDLEKKKIS
nr:hypothetical protein [Tanacetum cinerariifolium]